MGLLWLVYQYYSRVKPVENIVPKVSGEEYAVSSNLRDAFCLFKPVG